MIGGSFRHVLTGHGDLGAGRRDLFRRLRYLPHRVVQRLRRRVQRVTDSGVVPSVASPHSAAEVVCSHVLEDLARLDDRMKQGVERLVDSLDDPLEISYMVRGVGSCAELASDSSLSE